MEYEVNFGNKRNANLYETQLRLVNPGDVNEKAPITVEAIGAHPQAVEVGHPLS
jgi:hypothetical protein